MEQTMTGHVFPIFALQSSDAIQLRRPGLVLDLPARLGFILTFLKIPLTAAMAWMVYEHSLVTSSLLVALSVLIDIADGIIFNRSKFATDSFLRRSRRIWDSMLDHFMIWTTLLVAVFIIGFPALVFLIIMIRELAVCIITAVPYVKRGFVHAPNMPSKLGAAMIGVQLIMFNTTATVPGSFIVVFLAVSIIGLICYIRTPRHV